MYRTLKVWCVLTCWTTAGMYTSFASLKLLSVYVRSNCFMTAVCSRSPSYALEAACMQMQTLMREPNPFSPLNVGAARMMKRDNEMFERTAMVWTKHHANGNVVSEILFVVHFYALF